MNKRNLNINLKELSNKYKDMGGLQVIIIIIISIVVFTSTIWNLADIILSPGKVDDWAVLDLATRNRGYYYNNKLSCKIYMNIYEVIDCNNPDYVNGYGDDRYVIICYLNEKNETLCTLYTSESFESMCKTLKTMHKENISVREFQIYMRDLTADSFEGKIILKDWPIKSK